MEQKLQKPYLTSYNLLTEQDLRQAHYQILLITSMKEFIKLNAKMNAIMKNVKRVELNKDCECCLEYTNPKDDLILYKSLCCNKNYQKEVFENLKKRFAIY